VGFVCGESIKGTGLHAGRAEIAQTLIDLGDIPGRGHHRHVEFRHCLDAATAAFAAIADGVEAILQGVFEPGRV
jgi:hypothetical protein